MCLFSFLIHYIRRNENTPHMRLTDTTKAEIKLFHSTVHKDIEFDDLVSKTLDHLINKGLVDLTTNGYDEHTDAVFDYLETF